MVDAKVIHAEQAKRYSNEDLVKATRTEVHAALQAEQPVPLREKEEDPDDHHQRQKAHGKKLWKLADEMVAKCL